MADTKVGIILEAQDRATRQIKDVSASLDTMRNRFEKQIDASKQFATGIAAAGVALGGFIGYGVKVAADLQTAKIGLTTLLGSAEEAGKTVERIKKESARTPFELVGLTQATQLLASVTKNGDKAIDIILNVGEGLAAMGKGQAELDRIIVNLQQVAAVGKASMTDIKQFAFAGIPIFEMLTEQTKLSGEALSKFIEGGGVSFEMLTTMFDKANDAGGRFLMPIMTKLVLLTKASQT
jgi:tape measure domain